MGAYITPGYMQFLPFQIYWFRIFYISSNWSEWRKVQLQTCIKVEKIKVFATKTLVGIERFWEDYLHEIFLALAKTCSKLALLWSPCPTTTPRYLWGSLLILLPATVCSYSFELYANVLSKLNVKPMNFPTSTIWEITAANWDLFWTIKVPSSAYSDAGLCFPHQTKKPWLLRE